MTGGVTGGVPVVGGATGGVTGGVVGLPLGGVTGGLPGTGVGVTLGVVEVVGLTGVPPESVSPQPTTSISATHDATRVRRGARDEDDGADETTDDKRMRAVLAQRSGD